MTTIAWDGKTLAADKLADGGGLARTTTKIFRVDSALVAVSGEADAAREMLHWFHSDTYKFPEAQRSRDSGGNSRCVLVVVVPGTPGVHVYETTPYPIVFEDRFYATGSGRDFAIAAMYLGKSAREAVEIAALFDVNTGNGVDELQLEVPLMAAAD